MATVSFNKEGPGRGAFGNIFGNGHRKTASGTFAFDASYPTGGEDISEITSLFRECKGVIFESKGGRFFETDLTNKKVRAMQFDYPAAAAGAAVEVPNLTDLSAVTGVGWFAYGN